ncbi:MAG: hypothetical protein MI975_16190 [Cytophagales bacterium]|nr:hypothetical protein [Cytophagales bacterium]
MSKTVLLKKKNVIVEHDKQQNYLYLNWVGFQTEEGIYEAGEDILEIFKKLDCSNVINDNREVQGPWNKASEWTQSYWFPAMIKAGLKKFAWIFPDNVFAELSASKAMPNTEVVHKFYEYEAAENWLKTQTETKV